MPSAIAAAGVLLLAILAPFEVSAPIVRIRWQLLTNLEAALLLALTAWTAALVWRRRVPHTTPLVWPWLGLIAAMALASAAAPVDSANAWHMTGRSAAAAAVCLLTVDGIRSRRRLRWALTACAGAGVLVALLVMLEYAQVPWVLRALRLFRPHVTILGGQVRAGGPLQYPTIASMYLEVVFAFGLGLMLDAVDGSRRRTVLLWLLALVAISEGIVLTFSRAGLITIGVSLAIAGGLRLRRRGPDVGVAHVGAVALTILLLLIVSRSAGSTWLRLTSEGQDAWYQAAVAAPPNLWMTANRVDYVTVSVTNTGRVSWDSSSEPPIVLSYHWLQADADRVVAFEGERTTFARPVAPGETAIVRALVRAPARAGVYRLEWDLAQEGRLWFSTEQYAPPSTMSAAVVTGSAASGPLAAIERPRRAVRPGRIVLWRAAARMIAAHPLLGVGPDNFRLLYADYAGLSGADPRTHSNNMYLEVLAGGGAVAGAAFAWLLGTAVRLLAAICKGSDPIQLGVAAAAVAIGLHGTVDSFLSFAPTYILFGLTLGFASVVAAGMETLSDADRV